MTSYYASSTLFPELLLQQGNVPESKVARTDPHNVYSSKHYFLPLQNINRNIAI